MTTPGACVALYPGARALHEIDWIGLDLDHALARYNVEPLMALSHAAFATYLVERCGRPPSLAAPQTGLQRELCAKGVIADFVTGDLIKLRADGRVEAAVHGMRGGVAKVCVASCCRWCFAMWWHFGWLADAIGRIG
jgi:hypothetical protein